MGAELILQNNITGLLVINNGLAGIDGKSAYEVYTENGGSLSEIDFNRLIGELPYILQNHNAIGRRDVAEAHPASAVAFSDSGGLITGNTVEAALLDIASKLILTVPKLITSEEILNKLADMSGLLSSDSYYEEV